MEESTRHVKAIASMILSMLILTIPYRMKNAQMRSIQAISCQISRMSEVCSIEHESAADNNIDNLA